MTKEQFVAALRRTALDGGVHATLTNLRKPPGRSPPAAYREEAAWYAQLQPNEREMLERVIRRCADAAVFGVLTALDGVSPVEDGPEKGSFRLLYEKNGEVKELSPGEGPFLHDLL